MPRSNEGRAPQLLSLCSRAGEPQLLSRRAATTEARAPRARAPQREATAMRSPCTATKSSPRSRQLEKAHTQPRRPNAAKKQLINFKKWISGDWLLKGYLFLDNKRAGFYSPISSDSCPEALSLHSSG